MGTRTADTNGELATGNLPQHTPLPWRTIPEHDKRHRVIPIMAISGANRPGIDGAVLVASCADHHVMWPTALSNAEFIVRAANSHEALIKALSDLLRVLGEGNKFGRPIDMIDRRYTEFAIAALALAGHAGNL